MPALSGGRDRPALGFSQPQWQMNPLTLIILQKWLTLFSFPVLGRLAAEFAQVTYHPATKVTSAFLPRMSTTYAQ
jgi:hypothetical protein